MPISLEIETCPPPPGPLLFSEVDTAEKTLCGVRKFLWSYLHHLWFVHALTNSLFDDSACLTIRETVDIRCCRCCAVSGRVGHRCFVSCSVPIPLFSSLLSSFFLLVVRVTLMITSCSSNSSNSSAPPLPRLPRILQSHIFPNPPNLQNVQIPLSQQETYRTQ